MKYLCKCNVFSILYILQVLSNTVEPFSLNEQSIEKHLLFNYKLTENFHSIYAFFIENSIILNSFKKSKQLQLVGLLTVLNISYISCSKTFLNMNSVQSKSKTETYRDPGRPSEYLFVRQELKTCRTAVDVKFSDAIISSPLRCRFFSLITKSKSSGSESFSGVESKGLMAIFEPVHQKHHCTK